MMMTPEARRLGGGGVGLGVLGWVGGWVGCWVVVVVGWWWWWWLLVWLGLFPFFFFKKNFIVPSREGTLEGLFFFFPFSDFFDFSKTIFSIFVFFDFY